MTFPVRRLLLATASLSALALSGCTLASDSTSAALTGPIGNIRGVAHGGNQPISGMHIYVYAANTSAYGAASQSLLSNVSGVTTEDSNSNYYVTTDGGGNFALTGDYSCTAGQEVYLYGVGGNTGAGPNTSAGMLAILGQCPVTGNSLASVTPYVWMNEVTTVAAAYALSGFAVDATHISDDEAAIGNTTAAIAHNGMANAFGNSNNLVNIATGAALSTTGSVPTTNSGVQGVAIIVPQAQINTIADVLAACVNTTSTAGSMSASCTTLLGDATSDGTASGTVPTDTATAAINIAHHPTTHVAALYGLINGQPAFAGDDATAPADFTISILYPQGGTATVGIAADSVGNVFFTYGSGNLVFKVTPAAVETNASISPKGPRHLAVDSNNNVWVPSTQTSSTSDTISEFTNNLALTQQCNAVDTTVTPNVSVNGLAALAFDATGNLWAAGAQGQGLWLNSSCTPLGSVTIPSSSSDVAINSTGFVAFSAGATTTSALAIFNSTGTPVTNSPFTGGGLDTPEGVVAAPNGNFWLSNDANGTVSDFTPAGAPVVSGGYPTTVTAQYSGDFDGLGNYFTGGPGTGIYELNPSGTQIGTFVPTSADNQYLTVDPSGNVWYGGTKNVGEMIGIAAPKITPIVTATFSGKANFLP